MMPLKDGTEANDPRLGRLKQFDARNLQFPVRAVLAPKPPRSYTWSACIESLDQRDLGACVGFACAAEAAARPVAEKGITNEVGKVVYHDAQHIDPWEGCEFGDSGPDMAGTSVLAGMKIGQRRGWWKEYRWALTADEVVLAVGYKGPVVIGVDWYTQMMDPDAHGRIHALGNVEGGHAVGYNVKSGLFRIRNSWGSVWGQNGDCFLHRDDLALLLGTGGEAAIPTSRKRV